MSCYICTHHGFVRQLKVVYDKETSTKSDPYEYVKSIKDATLFKTQKAESFIESHDISGFIWKPTEVKPGIVKYAPESSYYGNDEYENDFLYKVKTIKIHNQSDIEFLTKQNSRDFRDRLFDNAQEAQNWCNSFNQSKLKSLLHDIEKCQKKIDALRRELTKQNCIS